MINRLKNAEKFLKELLIVVSSATLLTACDVQNTVPTVGFDNETELPTVAITAITTAVPAGTPTSVPTAVSSTMPTELPTENVTEAITEAPTAKPTEEPTNAPTEKPTEVPTAVPTEVPTPVPTEEPTAAPTSAPTAAETENPTHEPVEQPANFNKLIISELCAKNESVLSKTGKFSDWIELRNVSDEIVSLKNVGVRIEGEETFNVIPGEWRLAPGACIVLFADEYEFKLDSEGGTVVLFEGTPENAKNLDSVTYRESEENYSFCKDSVNGNVKSTKYMTPGYSNDDNGYEAYCSFLKAAGPIVINEIVVSNDSLLPQSDGTFCDWIELKNISNQNVLLSDYAVTDKKDKLKYTLPAVSLKPGELFVIMCSSEEKYDPSGYYHADFAVSASGEGVYLYKKDSRALIDNAYVSDVPYGGSYGRINGKGGYFYFKIPSPGADNVNGERKTGITPVSSVAPGVYGSAVSVELKGDGTVYYTLDGTEPDENSIKYTSPIGVSKNTVIRAVVYKKGCLPSSVATFSYFINPDTTLPVISLVTAPDNLWSDETGIYVEGNYDNYNQKWERPASVSFFENGKSFVIDCGLRLHGNGSRSSDAKKSFRVNFKAKYGEEALVCDLFSNGITEYDSLILRAGEDYRCSIFKNELAVTYAYRYLPSIVAQTGKFCSLYINGEYFGIYFLQERLTEKLGAAYFDVPEDEVIIEEFNPAEDSELYGIMSFAKNNDLSVKENYDYLCSKIDIESMTDWYIYEAYVGNNDVVANVKYVKPGANAKWKWVAFDFDWSFKNHGRPFERLMVDGQWYTGWIIQSVIKNEEYQKYFLERLSYHINNTFKNHEILDVLEEYYTIIKPEIANERALWGKTVEEWEENVSLIRSYYTDYDRCRELVESIAVVFGLSDAEVNSYFG